MERVHLHADTWVRGTDFGITPPCWSGLQLGFEMLPTVSSGLFCWFEYVGSSLLGVGFMPHTSVSVSCRYQDEVVKKIEHRLAAWTHLPTEHQEDMQASRG